MFMGVRDEEAILYPMMFVFCFLTFVVQNLTCPDMRAFERRGEKADYCA
jgi:hypothetical protein